MNDPPARTLQPATSMVYFVLDNVRRMPPRTPGTHSEWFQPPHLAEDAARICTLLCMSSSSRRLASIAFRICLSNAFSRPPDPPEVRVDPLAVVAASPCPSVSCCACNTGIGLPVRLLARARFLFHFLPIRERVCSALTLVWPLLNFSFLRKISG